MPTGYTATLADGEQSFEAFVWSCARAFGAAVLMRDDPSGATITEERIVDHYYEKRTKECETVLAEWNGTSEEGRRALYDSWVVSNTASRRKEEARRLAQKARYEAMLKQARTWAPPSDEHSGLRDFMIEQLSSSIIFDCSTYDRGPVPEFAEWCSGHGAELARAVAYANEELAKERERNESRLRWFRLLLASVPMPAREGNQPGKTGGGDGG